MSLYSRWQGSTLSNVEKELIFKRVNTGFVTYHTRDGRFFYLQPSPSMTVKNNDIFSAEHCTPPPENTFIEADVESEEEKIIKEKDIWKKYTIKYIRGWKFFDPSAIAQRKKLIDWEQIVRFFAYPFKGPFDIIEPIATCAALYAFSSPPITNQTGGINTAILSRKTQWNAFKRPMSIIPHEYFTPHHQFFYCLSEKEKVLTKYQSEEVNLAFLNPERFVVDIPIAIENLSIKGYSGVTKEYIEEDRQLITAYLLDSLLLKPDPMKKLEKPVTEAVYSIREEYKKSGISLYYQNLGDAIPKLTASISRLQSDADPKTNHVSRVVELWKEMHLKTKHIISTPLSIPRRYQISENARLLYVELFDVFGCEYWIPQHEVIKITTLKDDSDYSHALIELIEQGLALRDRRGIKLLEN